MSYTKTTWQDGVTPLSASNLNKIENELYTLDPLLSLPTDIEKLQINELLLMLQLSVNSSNIDAWCDLLGDTSLINTSASASYQVTGGSLSTGPAFSLGSWGGVYYINNSSSNQKIGQTILCPINSTTMKFYTQFRTANSINATVTCKIYNSTGTTLVGICTNPINVNTMPGGNYMDYTFTFTGLTLIANTTYLITLEPSYSTGNYAYVPYGGGYANGDMKIYNGSTWSTVAGSDIFGTIYLDGTVVWNSVTSTEILSRMAVVATQTLGTGTITWYLSDDMTNWVQISNLRAMHNINFDANTVYLKCKITGDSTVQAVAWGGL